MRNLGFGKKIDNLVLSLLRKVLLPHPSRRYTLSQIKNHIWCKKKFRDADGKLLEPELVSPPLKRHYGVGLAADQVEGGVRARNTSGDGGGSSGGENRDPADGVMIAGGGVSDQRLSASQPACAFRTSVSGGSGSGRGVLTTNLSGASSSGGGSSKDMMGQFGGFTQPAQLSDLFCGSQSGTQTQGGSQTQFQRLVKRMTRFWVNTPMADTVKFLTGILGKMNYNYKAKSRGHYIIETLDRRGGILSFRATLIQVDHRILVDFRLSRGDGLEFKKHFGKIKTNCQEVIEPGPILWPAIVAADAIPGVPS